MGKINWGRVVGCGLVTGGVYLMLAGPIFFFALHETEFAQAMYAARAAARPRFEPTALSSGLNLLGGIWMMWLYAAIRPRYGPGPKTAAVAGLAAWVAYAVIQVQLSTLLLMPVSLSALAVPLGVALPSLIVAAVVGAWQYKE